jgi:Tfp pilus assembly PilM family ATPase
MRIPGKRVVAIDIAPERVALAEVETGRRPRLHAWAIVEGPFADSSAMAQRIREAYSAGGFTARLAYVAPGIQVEHRHLSLPPLHGRGLRRVIEREVRRDSNISPQEQVFDYAVVGESVERSGARKKEILLAIAAEPEVNRYIRIVEEAGLNPWLVTSRPLALMAAVALQDGGGGPVVAASLDGIHLQALVAEEGILHLSREITLSATPGTNGAEWVDEVATEIHRSLLYFFEKSPRWRVGRIVLAGNSANLGDLREALAKDPTVRVEIFDPKDGVELYAPEGEGSAWRTALPGLAVPLGLASGRPEVGIGLLPRHVQERKWGKVRRVAVAGIAAGALVLGSITLYAVTRGEESLRKVLDSQRTMLINLERQMREVEEAERQRELHQARLSLLEGGLWSGPFWRGVFREISLYAPPDLLLHQLKLEAGPGGYRMVLTGQVISGSPYEAHVGFNRFYEGLQGSPFLQAVTLLQPVRVSRVPRPEPEQETGEPEGTKAAARTTPVPEGQSRLEFSLALGLRAVAGR